jgi:hypothetical protein
LACYLSNIIGLPCCELYDFVSSRSIFKQNKEISFQVDEKNNDIRPLSFGFWSCGVKICTLNIGHKIFLVIMSQFFFNAIDFGYCLTITILKLLQDKKNIPPKFNWNCVMNLNLKLWIWKYQKMIWYYLHKKRIFFPK